MLSAFFLKRKLQSKKIVLANGSGVLGRKVLEELLKYHPLVVVSDPNPELIPEHPNLKKIKLELTKPDAVDRLIEDAIELLGKIDFFLYLPWEITTEGSELSDWNRIKLLFAELTLIPMYTAIQLQKLLPLGVQIFVAIPQGNVFPTLGHQILEATSAATLRFTHVFRGEQKRTFRQSCLPFSTFSEKEGKNVARRLLRRLVFTKNI